MSSAKREFVPDFSSDFGTTDAVHDFSPLIRVYENGRVERLTGEEIVPASDDPVTGHVRSKDVDIPLSNGVSARLYVPKTIIPGQKLPLVVYIHGGGFVVGTAFFPVYHNYLNLLVAEANVVVVSVNYRRPPEHSLPIAYDDSWAAMVASNSQYSIGEGQEAWLKDHADFQNVFFAGDSAGANIAHNMALRAGLENLDGMNLVGTVLMHPYFWGEKPIGGEPVAINERRFPAELWRFANPSSSGSDDPLMNPALDRNLERLGGSRVLVCVAEEDKLRDRGYYYVEALGKSGWDGKMEVMEIKGEGHGFHLLDPNCENAVAMMKGVVSFLNHDK